MNTTDFDKIVSRRDTDSVKWNNYPEDVLPMWVADTDFEVPVPIQEALQKRVRHAFFGYSHDPDKTLEKAAANWCETRFGWKFGPESVAFSHNVVGAISMCIQAFTKPGDSVLFFSPSYPPFYSIPAINGRKALTSSLGRDHGRFAINFEDLERKLAAPDTSMFMLCNPQNPTGRAFTRQELTRLGELCLKHKVLVVSDEIHCDFVFGGEGHIPFATLSDEIAQNCLVAINPSKTFNIADLHCSALISHNPELLARFKKMTDIAAVHAGVFGRLAFVAAYTQCAYYADAMREYVKANLEYAVEYVNANIPGVVTAMPESTYLLWLDFRALGLEQDELKNFLLNKAKLALNSGTDFGEEGRGFMRMNLACPRSTLQEGLSRLEKAVKARG